MRSKKDTVYIKFEVIERKYNIIMTTGREYCVYRYLRNPDQIEYNDGASLLHYSHISCEVSKQVINPRHIERYRMIETKTGEIITLEKVEGEYSTYYHEVDFEIYKREE